MSREVELQVLHQSQTSHTKKHFTHQLPLSLHSTPTQPPLTGTQPRVYANGPEYLSSSAWMEAGGMVQHEVPSMQHFHPTESIFHLHTLQQPPGATSPVPLSKIMRCRTD